MEGDRTECDCGYGIERVELDGDGFCVSFEPAQLDEIKAFFQENGFVVVRNGVSEELLDGLKKDICATAQFEDGKLPDLTTADCKIIDWENDVYKSKYNVGKGFLGSRPVLSVEGTKVRQHEPLVRVFQTLLHQDAIFCKFDRYGLMRPTKGRPEWKTDRGFVHWDQNPSLEPNFSRVQGVLAVSEHTSSSGGFWCIPKFTTHHFAKWAAENPRKECDGDLIDVTNDCLRFNQDAGRQYLHLGFPHPTWKLAQ